jgi:hypothetical protein
MKKILVILPAAIVILVLIGALVWPRPTAAAPIPVHLVEGVFHAFLVVRTATGELLASGDLRQVPRDGKVESRMSFRFKDGSVMDETVMFTQQRVFSMETYHLLQHGPAFSEDTDVTMERASGEYRVKTKDHKDGKEEVIDGTLDLPTDVYNGMIFTVLKNLHEGAGETVHYVAFTPKPQLIELDFVPGGTEKISVGNLAKKASHYVLKPKLGTLRKVVATLAGRMPPDNHLWILADEVPTFLKFEGPLYPEGPVWRVELTTPELLD